MKFDKTVLITGAAGFVGCHVVKQLVYLGADVHIIVRESTDTWRINDIIHKTNIHKFDLCDYKELRRLISNIKPDVVYHLAACGVNYNEQTSLLLFETNVNTTLSLLEAVGEYCSSSRIVIAGSCFEYGDINGNITENTPLTPVNLYGVSKVSAVMAVQIIAKKLGISYMVCRPFGIYGPYESLNRIIPHVFLSIIHGRSLMVTGGKQIRDYTYVEDVAEAFITAGIVKEESQIVNISSGQAIDLKTLISSAIEITGLKADIQWGAVPYRSDEMWSLVGDNSAAKNTLGWYPRHSLKEGLEKTYKWFNENISFYNN